MEETARLAGVKEGIKPLRDPHISRGALVPFLRELACKVDVFVVLVTLSGKDVSMDRDITVG